MTSRHRVSRTRRVPGFVVGVVVLALAGCAFRGSPASPDKKPLMEGPLSYQLVRTFLTGAEVGNVAVSPTGRYVATTAITTTFIDLWDVEGGSQSVKLVGHRLAPIGALEFSADGRLLVSGGGVLETGLPEPSLRVWDVASARAIDTIPLAQSARILSVAVSSDASQILSVSADSLKLWTLPRRDAANGMWVDHTEHSTICGMTTSQDMKMVATGGRDMRVLVRSASDMNRYDVLLGHDEAPCFLQFSPDGTALVSWDYASIRSKIRLWDPLRAAARNQIDIRGRTHAVFFDGAEPVAIIRGTVLRAESKPIESITLPDRLSLISVMDGRVLGELPGSPKRIVTTPEGRVVVSVAWDGSVMVFRRGTAR